MIHESFPSPSRKTLMDHEAQERDKMPDAGQQADATPTPTGHLHRGQMLRPGSHGSLGELDWW
jgi:hypothetical protein